MNELYIYIYGKELIPKFHRVSGLKETKVG